MQGTREPRSLLNMQQRNPKVQRIANYNNDVGEARQATQVCEQWHSLHQVWAAHVSPLYVPCGSSPLRCSSVDSKKSKCSCSSWSVKRDRSKSSTVRRERTSARRGRTRFFLRESRRRQQLQKCRLLSAVGGRIRSTRNLHPNSAVHSVIRQRSHRIWQKLRIGSSVP